MIWRISGQHLLTLVLLSHCLGTSRIKRYFYWISHSNDLLKSQCTCEDVNQTNFFQIKMEPKEELKDEIAAEVVEPEKLKPFEGELLKVMHQIHPERSIFTFDTSIVISSDFDSGNLQNAEICTDLTVNHTEIKPQQILQESAEAASALQEAEESKVCEVDVYQKIEDDVFGFNLWLSPDSLPFVQGQSQRAQFYFSVGGLPAAKSLEKRRILRFCVKNMSNHQKLISYGHRPVFVVLPPREYREVYIEHKKPMYKLAWRRLPADSCSIKSGCEEGHELFFEFLVPDCVTERDYIIFAYVQPFSLSDIRLSVEDFTKKCGKIGLYCHSNTLVLSSEGWPMDILTVTAEKSASGEHTFDEPMYDEAAILNQDASKNQLPRAFNKKSIYISSRVHCGETVASFFLQGILDFLTSDTVQSKMLLDLYVFKIVPCLNPDGVYRGYWRNDIYGTNLNRVYSEPDPKLYPTIYASKTAVLHEHKLARLKAFIDLHGHCTKRGCFIFGNSIDQQTDESLEQLLFAKVLSLNTVNFDHNECSYNDAENNKKDKKGDARSGSSRASIYRETKLPYCFTLEGNYATGIRINTLQARFDAVTGKKILKEETPVQDTSSSFYATRKIPIYTAEVYQDVGQALMISLLDLAGSNPLTRLLKTPVETLPEALQRLKSEIKKELSKPGLKSLKKLGKKKKSKASSVDFELVLKEPSSNAPEADAARINAPAKVAETEETKQDFVDMAP